MRRILVENAPRKLRLRHGGELQRVDLDTGKVEPWDFSPDGKRLIVLDKANQLFCEWDLNTFQQTPGNRRTSLKHGLRARGEFDSLSGVMSAETAKFADALASVEALSVDDQAALIEVVNKRITAARRREMLREIAEARADYRRGHVKRGSAADLMRELRGK
jgi:hypothetical protein